MTTLKRVICLITVLSLLIVCGSVVVATNQKVATGIEKFYQDIFAQRKGNKSPDVTVDKAEQEVYQNFYKELAEAGKEQNKENVVATVMGENIYKSDVIIGLANYNLGVNVNLLKLPDEQSKNEYVAKYGMTEQQALELLIARVYARKSIDKELLAKIEAEVEAMLDEHVQLTKETVQYDYYNSFLKACGFSEADYEAHIRKNLVDTSAFNNMFNEAYPPSEYSDQERETLREEYRLHLVKLATES